MIHFYFDFLSPYAYLAHARLPRLAAARGQALAYHPVDLEWIKLKAGNTGPKTREMPLKLAYARTDMQRWARLYGVPLTPLRSYASARLNRGTFFAEDRGMAGDYVTLAWSTVYGQGQEMNDDAVLSGIARVLGWDPVPFLTYLSSEEAANRLRESNDAAHAQGVFGVPTMIVGTEFWWGNDRLDFLDQYLATGTPG